MREKNIPGKIIALDMPTPTVAAAAQAVGTDPEYIVKSLLFNVGGETILAITCGPAHIERRTIATHFNIGRKKVKLANPEFVLQETGYSVGAMPPFGHYTALPTLIDKRVLEKEHVYAGGGSDQTLLRVDPQVILEVTQAQVMDLHIPQKTGRESQAG